MNMLDLVLILILVFHMFVGWRKGLFGLLGEVGGLILGLWLGITYFRSAAGFVSTYLVGPAWLLLLLCFLGLLVLGLLVARAAASILKHLVSVPGLSNIDRIAGAAAGLAAGTILAILLVSLLTVLSWPYFIDLIQSSEIGQYFWSVVPVFNRYLWEELCPHFPLPQGLLTKITNLIPTVSMTG